jgi:hypothetical protein
MPADSELILVRGLYREFGGLIAFEYAIDIASCASKLVDGVESVRDQAAVVTNWREG